MHGMGKGVRSVKDGMNEVSDNLKIDEKEAPQPPKGEKVE